MPLRETSGPEVEKYLEAARDADANLLRGIAENFLGVAELEAVDIRNPDKGGLERAQVHLEAAGTYLQTTIARAQDVLKNVPGGGSSALDAMIRSRAEATTETVKAFEKAVSELTTQVKTGKYPKMSACLTVWSALDPLLSVFKVNGGVHKSEGF